jgi:hypothetical protein
MYLGTSRLETVPDQRRVDSEIFHFPSGSASEGGGNDATATATADEAVGTTTCCNCNERSATFQAKI